MLRTHLKKREKLGHKKTKENKEGMKKERKKEGVECAKNKVFIEVYVQIVCHFIEASLEILLFYVFVAVFMMLHACPFP